MKDLPESILIRSQRGTHDVRAGHRFQQQDAVSELSAPQGIFTVLVITWMVFSREATNLIPHLARGGPDTPAEKIEIIHHGSTAGFGAIGQPIPCLPEQSMRMSHCRTFMLDHRAVHTNNTAGDCTRIRRLVQGCERQGKPGRIRKRVIIVKGQVLA